MDKRTDIWAFGCILYECLTGKKAFNGETISETLAEVLRGEPDWKLIPSQLDVDFEYVLRRCLQRDLKLRYRDIADVWLDIETPLVRSSVISTHRNSFLWPIVIAAVALVMGMLIGPYLMRHLRPAPNPKVVTFIKVEPGRILAGWETAQDMPRPTRTAMAISNDGKRFLMVKLEER